MLRVGLRYLLSLVFLSVATGFAGPASAQTDKPAAASDPAGNQKSGATATSPQAQPTDEADPLKRAPNDKQKKQQKRNLNIELSKTYKKWLNEDVVWIITDEERAAFKQLSNDEERDNFIEAFWQRRDPTPDTEENEYKEEHYRRIAYANEHFAAGIPGWKSDRGRIYIMYGAADEVDSHPSGGTYERPMEEGGGETSTFPFEDWRYRYLEGIG
jgi:GWxTD domain-containing protein